MASGDGELFIDLECGGATTTTTSPTTSEEEVSGRMTISRACSGALSYNKLMGSESDIDDVSNLSNVSCGRVELVIENGLGGEETREVVALVEKKNPGEPRKKPNTKKSSKPPRPPKGPLLSASDLKLVKELSELAARKRARNERMKALRKMKEAKRPASSSNVTALVMTALFFIVIIFQGAFSGHTVRKELVESPAPATTKEGLMPFQLLNNAPINGMNQPSSLSFRSLEHPSNSIPQEEGKDSR